MVKTDRRSRGVTLLETMIAALVLAVALLGLIGVATVAGSASGYNHERTIAAGEIQAALEDTRGVNITQNFNLFNSTFPSGQPIPAYTNRALRNELIVLTVLSQTATTITYQLTLTYTNFKGLPMTETISTERAQ